MPLPGFVKRRAEGRIMGAALKELKARAEACSIGCGVRRYAGAVTA